jgi:hypothetical protein
MNLPSAITYPGFGNFPYALALGAIITGRRFIEVGGFGNAIFLQTSATLQPTTACFKAKTIYSSVYLDFFMQTSSPSGR